MTDDSFELTRRKVLAGLGTVGVASAGAGLGTSAYFSDQETFTNNSLVAGSLDLKVDWEEHYSDWMGAETEYARMPAEGEMPDYVLPAPNGESQNIELVVDDFEALWDATSIEALPDDGTGDGTANDGIQDDIGDACSRLVDVGPESAGLSSDLRTNGTVNGQTTEPGDPLVNVSDVKPGDFGEVTFSIHLCDNPGYVWLNSPGEAVYEENGVTDPEAADPDEEEGVVELPDAIQTRIWYDDSDEGACNNRLDTVQGQLDVMLVVDTSGSIEADEMTNIKTGLDAFVDELPDSDDVRVGTLTFGDDTVSITDPLQPTTGLSLSVTLPDQGTGNTPMPAGLDIADQILRDSRPGAEKVILLLTDGGPNYANTSYSAGGFTAPRDSSTSYSADSGDGIYDQGSANSTVNEDEQDETFVVADSIKTAGTRIIAVNAGDDPTANLESGATPHDEYLRNGISTDPDGANYFESSPSNLEAIAMDLAAAAITSEEVIWGVGSDTGEKSLRETIAALQSGNGIPLDGNRDTAFDEVDGDPTAESRECFSAGTTHCLGFEWWLPIDHGNEVQTDSATFNVGFYTEQCRHNDGSGMPPESADGPDGESEVL
jgi:predicted ribosomally synthesized peptide with SipW-like signal peptide